MGPCMVLPQDPLHGLGMVCSLLLQLPATRFGMGRNSPEPFWGILRWHTCPYSLLSCKQPQLGLAAPRSNWCEPQAVQGMLCPRCRVPPSAPASAADKLQGHHPTGTAPPRAAAEMIEGINRKLSVLGSIGHPINSQPDGSSLAGWVLCGAGCHHVTRAGTEQALLWGMWQ